LKRERLFEQGKVKNPRGPNTGRWTPYVKTGVKPHGCPQWYYDSMRGGEKSYETRLKMVETKVGGFWYGAVIYWSKDTKQMIRQSPKMRQWALAVMARDNFTCWYTGQRGQVEAHHIVPFNALMKKYEISSVEEAYACEALWDVSNGITMSKVAHKWHHEIWGFKA